MGELRIIPVEGIGEIKKDDDIAALVVQYAALEDRDVVVISSKAVSKAEGRVVEERELIPSAFAYQLSKLTQSSPAYCELVLRESAGILRTAKGVIIARTKHGFVMANAGVDASNTGAAGRFITLPINPDASAQRICRAITAKTGKQVAVIIADTFGRAWRNGQTNMAIGASGIAVMDDYRGKTDNDGRDMSKTCISVADELAAAADLVAGKVSRVPAVIIRGYEYSTGEGIEPLLMDESKNLFQ